MLEDVVIEQLTARVVTTDYTYATGGDEMHIYAATVRVGKKIIGFLYRGAEEDEWFVDAWFARGRSMPSYINSLDRILGGSKDMSVMARRLLAHEGYITFQE